MNRIAVVVPFADDPSFAQTVEAFAAESLVSRVLVPHSGTFTARGTKVVAVAVDSWTSGHGLNSLLSSVSEDYVLLCTQAGGLTLGARALERMTTVAAATGAGMVYADYVEFKKGSRLEHPVNDYQFGSVRNSAAAEFPVFHQKAITHRNDPVYPAIVVGKPPMEDKFLGDATQQILGPLIKLIHKEVTGLWAYYEAGFHNMLVVAIEQRYQKEALKATLGIMGTDQLSLTKCIVTVSAGVDPCDWDAVLREIREHFDPHRDFVMIPKVPLDTLDFTSFTMNLGSKMVVDATRKPGRAPAEHGGPGEGPGLDRRGGSAYAGTIVSDARAFDTRILDAAFPQETILVVKVQAGGRRSLKSS